LVVYAIVLAMHGHTNIKVNVKYGKQYLGMIIQISYSFFKNISCCDNATVSTGR